MVLKSSGSKRCKLEHRLGFYYFLWKSPWLSSERILHCPSNLSQEAQHWKVNHLWNPHSKSWDEQLVKGIFLPDIADEIIRTPLNEIVQQDRLIWNRSNDGSYTVKSAYQMALTNLVDRSHLRSDGDWSFIWKLKVPPRVKLFLWRSCREALPTRVQLNGRGVPCPITCVLCDKELENMWHLIFTCQVSVDSRMLQNLWHKISPHLLIARSFKDLCLQLISELNEEDKANFVMTMWSLWKARNGKLWDNKTPNAASIVQYANSFYLDWIAANQISNSRNRTSHGSLSSVWVAPNPGLLKCNIDAGFNAANGKTSFGMCIRDDQGAFVLARTDWIPSCLPARDGEALCLFKAAQWVKDLGLHGVAFETDCQNVVNSLSKPSMDVSDFGSLF